MGVVHLAIGPTGDLVAVKALRPWLVGGHDGRERFGREVSTLRRVRGRRVAEVLDADVDGDPPYIVTRYVRGPSLDRVVADHGALQAGALTRLAAGLLEAISTVHRAGVVHRDVKPGNVVMGDDGPVLIDFGLARAVDETRLTATGLVIGTPGYLAPETVAGREPSPQADVHGWAATMAYAATGRPPYGRGPDAAVLDRIRRGEHDLNGLEPSLAAILHPALAPDPERRPTVGEIRDRLDSSGDTDATSVVMTAAPTASVPRSLSPTRLDLPAFATPAARPARPVAPGAQSGKSAPPAVPAAPANVPVPAGKARPLADMPARLAVGAGTLALLILIGVAPYVGAFTLFAVTVVARVAWRMRWRLNERRLARGAQRGDTWIAAIGTPWDVVVCAVPAAVQIVWVGVCGAVVGAAVGLSEQPNERLPYLAGGAVAMLLVWLGPGTARVRYGIRVLAAPLDRDSRLAWSVFVLFLALTWGLILWWDSYGTSWLPADGMPNPLGV